MSKIFSSIFDSKRPGVRKAQGLSLTMVIVAVIAIIVLVVVVMAFSGKFKIFNKATSDCASKGGSCLYADTNGQCPDGAVKMFGAKCDQDGMICCTAIDEKSDAGT